MAPNSVFVFMAGDNNLDKLGEQDIGEMCGADPSPELNVVIQFDRSRRLGGLMSGETTKRYVIENRTLVEKMDIGETNCGDPAVLFEFLKWGTGNYPAGRNIVIFWNHGGGAKDENPYQSLIGKLKLRMPEFTPQGERLIVPVRSPRNLTMAGSRAKLGSTVKGKDFEYCMVGKDDTSRDFLDNLELKSALSLPGQKFDIIAFDACLMNMVEVIYQLRELAEIVIGSEESEPGTGWEYRPVLSYLKSHGDADNATLAEQIVSLYRQSYALSHRNVTQSAVRTAALSGLAAALDDLARLLTVSLGTKKHLLAKALSDVQKFDDPDYIDLYHFAMLCRETMEDRDIGDASERVMQELEISVVANSTHGNRVKNAYGLSIYFPVKKPKKDVLAIYRQLDLSVDYPRWLALITAYHTPGVHR